jgi:hypothetical protein
MKNMLTLKKLTKEYKKLKKAYPKGTNVTSIWCVPPKDVMKDAMKLWEKYGGDYEEIIKFLMGLVFKQETKK